MRFALNALHTLPDHNLRR